MSDSVQTNGVDNVKADATITPENLASGAPTLDDDGLPVELPMDGWYYQTDTSPSGPVPLATLQRLVREKIDGMTPIWREGMTVWKSISDLPRLKAKLQGKLDVPARPPTADVPMMHMYTGDNGQVFIYDTTDCDWKSLAIYEDLCVAAGVTDGIIGDLKQVSMMVADTQALPVKSSFLDGEDAAEEVEEKKEAEPLDPEKAAKREKRRAYRERKKLKQAAGRWLNAKNNPNIYISGLPDDMSQEEIEELFKKAGVFKVDPDTGKSRVRIYTDDDGKRTGDALITYAKIESVQLALKNLHESEVRPGSRICVQQAEFQGDEHVATKEELKQEASANLAKNQQRARYQAARAEQKRLLESWGDEVNTSGKKNIVVLKHMFDPEESTGIKFYVELEDAIRKQIEKLTDIQKVSPIEGHPQGIVCIKFKDVQMAEVCIEMFDGKEIDGRTVDAHFYDGKTNFAAQVGRACRPSPPKRNVVKADTGEDAEEGEDWDDWMDDQSSDDDICPVRTE